MQRNNTVIILCAAVIAIGTAIQLLCVRNIKRAEPFIEVKLDKRELTMALEILSDYGPVIEDEALMIYGKTSVLASLMVSQRLDSAGIPDFEINDMTQSHILAEQGMTICLFLAYILMLVLIADIITVGIKKTYKMISLSLETEYFSDYIKEHKSMLLKKICAGVILILGSGVLIVKIIDYKIELPIAMIRRLFCADYADARITTSLNSTIILEYAMAFVNICCLIVLCICFIRLYRFRKDGKYGSN